MFGTIKHSLVKVALKGTVWSLLLPSGALPITAKIAWWNWQHLGGKLMHGNCVFSPAHWLIVCSHPLFIRDSDYLCHYS